MSLRSIKLKLIESFKKELNTSENKEFVEKEILEPIINKVINQIYPYFLWSGCFFMFMFVFVMIILFLNVRIYFLNK